MARELPVFKVRAGTREVFARSRTALDTPLASDAELWIEEVEDEARVVGAFGRGAGLPEDRPLARRGSGGPVSIVGAGSLHVLLRLADPAALLPCDVVRLVNRHVRPLLAALTKLGTPAHFFGRDWVSVRHMPVGWIGFAHDRRSGRAVIEAIIGTHVPFCERGGASLMGKEPAALSTVLGKRIDVGALGDAVARAYAEAGGREEVCLPAPAACEAESSDDLRADPPWTAVRHEAIGIVAAGKDRHGSLRLGGDMLASRDAVGEVEARVRSGELPGGVVDDVFGRPGTVLDGVRSLSSLKEVLEEART